MSEDYQKYIDANRARNRELEERGVYDAATGLGCCGERVWKRTPVPGLRCARVPVTMLKDAEYSADLSAEAWKRLRCRHDFEYWCTVCATIKHKGKSHRGPFMLNAPQRRVLRMLEADRVAERPIRLIMLKARQWGGSTLIEMYMSWIQTVHRTNWHSLICAHVKDASHTLRAMCRGVIDNYPPELWEGDAPPRVRAFERSGNTLRIEGRNCNITLASSENYNAVRGGDYSMAHLSEAAFWKSSLKHTPADVLRAVCGSVAYLPYTLVAIESTANGVGDFFHSEWMRCTQGHGDKQCVFVPWYEIEMYRLPVADDEVPGLVSTFSPYERALWEDGRTLEMIKWYRHKAAEYPSAAMMQAEYPGTDVEAFVNSGCNVFAPDKVEALRKDCRAGSQGEVSADGTRFVPDSRGAMTQWKAPAPGAEYVVAVDIGGRTMHADWSVIAVMRRGSRPEVCAQWRGHIDHDLLAARAVAVARYYNTALLVVESNTLESGAGGADPSLSVLSRMAQTYPNMYMRQSEDRLVPQGTDRVGFHTNRRTKPLLISTLIEYVREGKYVEHDHEACNELSTYTQTPAGGYEARKGTHDDILMTRALALHVMETSAPAASDVDDLLEQPSW